jgi:hypothetical protein
MWEPTLGRSPPYGRGPPPARSKPAQRTTRAQQRRPKRGARTARPSAGALIVRAGCDRLDCVQVRTART